MGRNQFDGKSFKKAVNSYYWRELPQVSFLSRQKFCLDKYVFDEAKHVFCRDKSMLATTKLLSRQKYACLSRQKVILVAALDNDQLQQRDYSMGRNMKV